MKLVSFRTLTYQTLNLSPCGCYFEAQTRDSCSSFSCDIKTNEPLLLFQKAKTRIQILEKNKFHALTSHFSVPHFWTQTPTCYGSSFLVSAQFVVKQQNISGVRSITWLEEMSKGANIRSMIPAGTSPPTLVASKVNLAHSRCHFTSVQFFWKQNHVQGSTCNFSLQHRHRRQLTRVASGRWETLVLTSHSAASFRVFVQLSVALMKFKWLNSLTEHLRQISF